MTALGTAGSALPAAAAWDATPGGTGTCAIVLLNTGGSAAEVSVDLSAFGSVPDSASTAQWATSVASDVPEAGAAYTPGQGRGVSGKRLSVTVPARTLLTVEVQGLKA
jgi:hypothetical protein